MRIDGYGMLRHSNRRWLPGRIRRVAPAMAIVSLAAVLSAAARADDELPARVGRVAEVSGQLFLAPEDRANDRAEVGVNYPVTSGDNLWVSADGRAEVEYGGGQFRLTGDTSLHVSRLDDHRLSLFIARGRAIVRVRVLEPGEVARVDAPNTQVQFTRPGLYRIDLGADRTTTVVTVREGEARVAFASATQQVLPGQTATLIGPEPVAADVRNGIDQNPFDFWSADRDRYYERGRGNPYVSSQMVGYAELDNYGTWQAYPDYGPVWFPASVAPGWRPTATAIG